MAKVFVITGPSGVGKGTLIERLCERVPSSLRCRQRRAAPARRGGWRLPFPTPEEFERRVEAGDFLEHADYSGHRYGTLREEVERRLAEGRSVVLEIEVQGARQVRDAMPEAVPIFIAPPGRGALRDRLEGRGRTPEAIERRLETARDRAFRPSRSSPRRS
jgi:guanylate kinase